MAKIIKPYSKWDTNALETEEGRLELEYADHKRQYDTLRKTKYARSENKAWANQLVVDSLFLLIAVREELDTREVIA